MRLMICGVVWSMCVEEDGWGLCVIMRTSATAIELEMRARGCMSKDTYAACFNIEKVSLRTIMQKFW